MKLDHFFEKLEHSMRKDLYKVGAGGVMVAATIVACVAEKQGWIDGTPDNPNDGNRTETEIPDIYTTIATWLDSNSPIIQEVAKRNNISPESVNGFEIEIGGIVGALENETIKVQFTGFTDNAGFFHTGMHNSFEYPNGVGLNVDVVDKGDGIFVIQESYEKDGQSIVVSEYPVNAASNLSKGLGVDFKLFPDTSLQAFLPLLKLGEPLIVSIPPHPNIQNDKQTYFFDVLVGNNNTVTIETPQPFSPIFLEKQEQVAESDIYTLTPNGFELRGEDGIIVMVPDIKPNTDDGTFTITDNGEEFTVEFSHINGRNLIFKDKDGRTWICDGETINHSYFEEELASMTAEEKLNAAPETIDGLQKSNLSTVPDKDYLVLYRNEEGIATITYNLQTGEALPLTEAGIIEFIMKDGRRLEMAYFEEIQEAIDYLYLERGASGSTRENMQHVEAIKEVQGLFGINLSNAPSELNTEFISGYEVLFDPNDRSRIAFGTYVVKFGDGTLIDGYTENNKFDQVYINQDADKVANLIGGGIITAPTQ